GKFDGRDVAVKRVVSEFVRLVDREADLLRESDTPSERYSIFLHGIVLVLKKCCSVAEEVRVELFQSLKSAREFFLGMHDKSNSDSLAPLEFHRDMKPQNVLLSTAGSRGVRAVISDFGLCKRVQPGRHSLSKRSGLAGTGREVDLQELTSFPVDVFSLGCIFYYVLSNGDHPFGDSLHRQTNIINGGIYVHESVALIESMIQKAPTDRPSIQPKKISIRTYKGHSVRDLLRAMRNKKHHYRELPEEVQKSLGKIPNEFLCYFTSRFPLVRARIAHMKEEDELQRKMNSDNIESEKWIRGHVVVRGKMTSKA
ncbi:ribonuclease 2-5A, partial [Ostertagia ostertagi]